MCITYIMKRCNILLILKYDARMWCVPWCKMLFNSEDSCLASCSDCCRAMMDDISDSNASRCLESPSTWWEGREKGEMSGGGRKRGEVMSRYLEKQTNRLQAYSFCILWYQVHDKNFHFYPFSSFSAVFLLLCSQGSRIGSMPTWWYMSSTWFSRSSRMSKARIPCV